MTRFESDFFFIAILLFIARVFVFEEFSFFIAAVDPSFCSRVNSFFEFYTINR